MSLFQKSVEKKYLNDLDTALIDKKYADFQDYFGNPEIQENIRNSKEEQYQGEFLIDLFVNILGYTKNPTPNFNLTTELKNISNSKKADGAILKGDYATAVIELKGTNTTDLDKIETQAFGYKNHHPKCKYVITSNFEKLRFYIQNAVDHVDFDLFNLTREQFSLMWLCLAKDNLLNDLPLKIKESSVLQEENITKKLYADYSKFREAIYNNLVKNNPETDKLLLFKKTQKLLDRFLFIFFAEDRLLLPPNSISEIVKQWADLKEKYDEYFPLYSRFKKYFGYMNTGYNGKKYDIYAYNGGLFKPDEVLDNITIDDDILYEHTLRLSSYDFETDVDVNILGHIFEHSLGEIAAIAATGGHAPLSKQPAVSIRKKDGIFYTPKYITKYIVENTVGKLCEEKRTKLGIVDEEYAKGRKNRKKEIVRTLDKKLDDYRNWLLSLTILDPACGSGAFLNQALEFLINEHRKIDELRGQLLGGAIIFSDITTDILEKNIYGVDLNEESVEIAKLSLWLRTAQKGRKLNTLSNNIKCGNSLIDDPEVAGDKAFNWHTEFPNIFQKKKKKAWHVTTATHNSRTSQRMWNLKIEPGEAVWLDGEKEVMVTQAILEIVNEDNLNVLAYNICGDHMHMMLVCEKEELNDIVAKVKGRSSYMLNREMGKHPSPNGNKPGTMVPNRGVNPSGQKEKPRRYADGTISPTWTRKFNTSFITSDEKFENTITYIKNNRNKHQLPENKELQKLIAEMICTREHAFRTEYKGGFDVVIGNPPYVDIKGLEPELVKDLFEKYTTTENRINLYSIFIEKGYSILKYKGFFSFINPNSILVNSSYTKIRKLLIDDITTIIKLPDDVFPDAKVETIIFEFRKGGSQEFAKTLVYPKDEKINFIDESKLLVQNKKFWKQFKAVNYNIYVSDQDIALLQKCENNSEHLENVADFTLGITPYDKYKGHSQETIKNRLFHSQTQLDETYKPLISGGNIVRYNVNSQVEEYIKYGEWLGAMREERFFLEPRIIVRQIVSGRPPRIYAGFTDKPFYFTQIGFGIIPKSGLLVKYLLTLINSSLLTYYHKYKFLDLEKELFQKILIANCKQFPIKLIGENEQQPFVEKADNIIELINKLDQKKDKFINRVKTNLEIEKISNKLDIFYDFDFKTFLSELKKQKIILSLVQQDEWEEYFNSYKSEINQLQSEIEKTDREIDRMVYELYGLTEEEIKIVEEE
nr:N-6 DNA methylase [uncultured Draconibacterium sp.]